MAHKPQTTRIATDPQASPALRRLVNHARADLPDTAALSHLAARLDTAIAANVPVPDLTLASSTTGSLAVKLLSAVLIAGVAAGGASHVLRGTDAPATSSVPSASAGTPPAVAPGVPQDVTTSVEAATEPAATNAALAPPLAAEASTARRRPVNRDSTNLTEAMLLDSARTKLRTDPRRAVELTREHARRFPKGVLVQEREVIAIEALRRLGEDEAAKQRGEDFNLQYPNSAHQSKIDQTLKGN